MSADEARRFAVEHAHYTDDLAFWRAAAARLGSPVLDLGCAAGRVAIPLARDGARGLGHRPLARDARRAAAPRRRARRRRWPGGCIPASGDLQDFALGTGFRLVLVAMNTLQVLTEPRRPGRVPGARARRTWPGRASSSSTSPCRTWRRSSRRWAWSAPADATATADRRGARATRPGTTAGTRPPRPWSSRSGSCERRDGRPLGETLRHHRVHLFTPGRAGRADRRRRDGADLRERRLRRAPPLDRYAERQVHRCRVAA